MKKPQPLAAMHSSHVCGRRRLGAQLHENLQLGDPTIVNPLFSKRTPMATEMYDDMYDDMYGDYYINADYPTREPNGIDYQMF